MRLTIIDIARLSGTSKSTVSRYLNKGSVSAKAAEKIEKVIRETNYQKNAAASQLKSNQSFLIGVMVNFANFGSTSITEVLKGFDRGLEHTHYKPFIMLNHNDTQTTIQNLQLLLAQGVDALVLGISTFNEPDVIDFLKGLSLPILVLGDHSDDFPYRKFNNVLAGQLMGKHLLEKGFKRLTFLTPPLDTDNMMRDRLKGIREFYTDDVISTYSYYSDGQNYQQTAKILSESQPDVIVGFSDRVVMSTLQYLNEHNVKIPKQVAVAGFGNSPYSAFTSPQLTTIHFDLFEVGLNLAKDIVALIQGKRIALVREDFPMTLIHRQST
ncbi:LacI family DNA-binding transcriptional regulator [Streptococcus merionis]|uniref:LacI family DNA-binding transcriptional regulator n=1 Tax=Streptococcus merionis TaxID=400065 RepID=UPI0026F1E3B8|nr:LacI family DNA-binding transcriptional regulator [Streptococcus merionis]